MRWLTIILIALAGTGTLAARADDAPPGRLLQQQEKARALADSLVGEVLDVQIRQLAENGLAERTMYRDVQAMRANLAALASEPMQAIARLLDEAEAAPAGAREQKLAAARAQAREVVGQLLAERQRLYRRMQVAKLSSQVRELMALQNKAFDTTRGLPDQPPQMREMLALAVLEEQADVDEFYQQMAAALADVSSWGGQAAAGALDGLRLLRAAQVDQHLAAAKSQLQESNYAGAVEQQQAVQKALGTLAERLDQALGLSGADREAALRFVRELRLRQEHLRGQATPQAISADGQSLLAQQAALHKELSRLLGALTKFPRTLPLLEAAKAASFEASAALFESHAAQATDLQSRVSANLAQIEFILDSAQAEGFGKSADMLASDVARLTALAGQLTGAQKKQQAAIDSVGSDGKAAEQHQRDVQKELANAAKVGDMATVVTARLDLAAQQAGVSLQALRDDAASVEGRRAQAEAALKALKMARSEVEVQLADVRRQQRAVQIGELARAAEALERASSAERVLARHLKRAAALSRVTKELGGLLELEHADVTAVAEQIGVGVRHSAPRVATALDQLRAKLADVAAGIDDLETKPAALLVPALVSVSGPVEAVSRSLAAAAAELRVEQGRLARDLEQIADKQLETATAVRQTVEQASAPFDEDLLSVLERLAAARQELQAAQVLRLQGEGNSKKARLLSTLWAVEELLQEQRLADELADEWAQGLANDALAPASVEQEVSQHAAERAKSASADVAATLVSAASAAAESASEILTGSPTTAASKRAAVRAELTKAHTLAKAQLEAKARSALQTPNAEAQVKAAGALAKAEQLARQAGQVLQVGAEPGVAATIEKTVQQIAAARDGDAAAVERAFDQLAASFSDIARIPKAALAAQAGAMVELRDRAALVDASAAAAVEQAGRHARLEPNDREVAGAVDYWLSKMQQAAGNLAAREQQIRQDRDVARVLAALADEQQSARQTIAKAAADLERSATHPEEVDRIAAARELLEAQQRFATAQVAAGEGAVQISGQEQVANVPIREALEIASRLHRALAAEEEAKADEGQGTGDRRQETGDRGQESGDRSQETGDRGQQENKKLGTQMVPASPEVTAKQIAGQEANAAAATAMAAAMQQGQGQPGQSQGKAEAAQQGEQAAKGQKGKGGKPGDTASDQPPEDADAEKGPAEGDSRAKAPGADAATGPGSVQNETWFSKLPPQIRSAIQGKARSQPPRGYEERLRRYFESVD